MNEPERMQILEMIDKGSISAEEGVRLLQSLADAAEPAEDEDVDTFFSSNGTAASDAGYPEWEEPQAAEAEFEPAQTGAEPGANPASAGAPGQAGDWNFEWPRQGWQLLLWLGVGFAVLGGVRRSVRSLLRSASRRRARFQRW